MNTETQQVTFRDRFSGRKVTGRYSRTLSNGNLIVMCDAKMARGGLYYETARVVKPSQVIA